MTVAADKLRALHFFATLPPTAVRDLAAEAHELLVRAGQTIEVQGEQSHAVYLVAAGALRARRISLDGREHVLSYVRPGDPVNLVSALDGGPAVATVEAATDARLYAVPVVAFRRILAEHNAVAMQVMLFLSAEVRRLTDMVEDLALHTVRTRVARFLLTHGAASGAERRWTQQEIAAHIGTVREMVARSLRALADEGLIERRRGRLLILDRQGLEEIAQGS